ncbi:MAG: hypothetical protein AAF220_09110, partial [Pseudomonadota bacterium]
LPFMMLVDVLDNGERFRFRLAGSDVATGVNPTGMILNDAVPPGAYHTHIVSLYQTAAARKSALYTVSAYGDDMSVISTGRYRVIQDHARWVDAGCNIASGKSEPKPFPIVQDINQHHERESLHNFCGVDLITLRRFLIDTKS